VSIAKYSVCKVNKNTQSSVLFPVLNGSNFNNQENENVKEQNTNYGI